MRMRAIATTLMFGFIAACGGAADEQPPVQPPPPPAPAPVADTPAPAPTADTPAAAPKASMADMQAAAMKSMAANMSDAAKVASLYAPDAVMFMPGSPESKGREAIQKSYQDWLDTTTNVQSANVRTWSKGNQLAVEFVATGTDKASNKPWGADGLAIYSFNDDGLITKDHTYVDFMTVMKQTGAFKDAKNPGRAISTLPTAATEAHVAKGDPTEDKDVVSEQAIGAAWGKLDLKAVLGFYAPDVVVDDQSETKPQKLDDLKKSFAAGMKRRTNAKWTDWADFGVEDVTIDDGEFAFTQNKKPVTVHVAEIDQWKDGKIVKAWVWENNLEAAQQLGTGPFAKTAAKPAAVKKDTTSKPPTK
jgi:uncharacterized protein (TIGR02246 family)